MNTNDRQKIFNTSRVALLKAAIAAVLGLSLSGAALADRDHGHHHHHDTHYRGDVHWHGGYRPYPYRHWHDGYWYHGYRGDRFGWWWSTGGIWYPYPQPIYPYPQYYPEPYQPPVIYRERGDVDNDIDTTAQATAAPTQTWYYYCRSTKSYFPYVSSCAEGWQEVPAAPSEQPSDFPAKDQPDDVQPTINEDE